MIHLVFKETAIRTTAVDNLAKIVTALQHVSYDGDVNLFIEADIKGLSYIVKLMQYASRFGDIDQFVARLEEIKNEFDTVSNLLNGELKLTIKHNGHEATYTPKSLIDGIILDDIKIKFDPKSKVLEISPSPQTSSPQTSYTVTTPESTYYTAPPNG